jgi:hypothetical protein
MPLSIIIRSDTAPCHFVSTRCTDNSLEYSFIPFPYVWCDTLNKIQCVQKEIQLTGETDFTETAKSDDHYVPHIGLHDESCYMQLSKMNILR